MLIFISTVSRYILDLLPILVTSLDEINWPQDWNNENTDHGISAAIDCTSHFRNRVHPRQVLINFFVFFYKKKNFN